jgi:hypothetical protein
MFAEILRYRGAITVRLRIREFEELEDLALDRLASARSKLVYADIRKNVRALRDPTGPINCC